MRYKYLYDDALTSFQGHLRCWLLESELVSDDSPVWAWRPVLDGKEIGQIFQVGDTLVVFDGSFVVGVVVDVVDVVVVIVVGCGCGEGGGVGGGGGRAYL